MAKKFIIMGNLNAITYKEIFPHIKDNKLWLGASNNSGGNYFIAPQDTVLVEGKKGYVDENGVKYVRVINIRWYTNLQANKPKQMPELTETYDPARYPKYDNYDAINVDRVAKIPKDYDGVMGVPISFLDKHDPFQFEIVGKDRDLTHDGKSGFIKGDEKYKRLFIKKAQPQFEIVGQMASTTVDETNHGYPYVGGKKKYARILIKKK